MACVRFACAGFGDLPRIVPHAAPEHFDNVAAKSEGENDLFNELSPCFAAGPIRFDIVDDATIHWPEDHPSVHFGTTTLTAQAPVDQEHRRIIFDSFFASTASNRR